MIKQFLSDVSWDDLDYQIIATPPGMLTNYLNCYFQRLMMYWCVTYSGPVVNITHCRSGFKAHSWVFVLCLYNVGQRLDLQCILLYRMGNWVSTSCWATWSAKIQGYTCNREYPAIGQLPIEDINSFKGEVLQYSILRDWNWTPLIGAYTRYW